MQTQALGLRLMLPENFWIEASFDRAIETTLELQTKTQGGSVSVGTDPFAEYSFEVGGDVFGVENQYTVNQLRVRATAMPDSVFGFYNPGFDFSLELRGSRFAFANQPNPVFNTRTVELDALSARADLSYYFFRSWSVFLFAERARLDDRFQDLNRPLAPVFIPETAVSTALSWPSSESGVGASFNRRVWGVRVSAARRIAAVTEDITQLFFARLDMRWTKSIESGLRYAHSRSEADPSLGPIDSYGFEMAYRF